MTNIAARFNDRPDGFTVLRLLLAVSVVAFHSVTIANGNANAIPAEFMTAASLILPAFFATSGFLVAASLARSRNGLEFLRRRLIRLAPALITVVLVTMLVMGPLLTRLHPGAYFAAPSLYTYLSNLVAIPAYGLPGLFEANPRAGVVNGSLWTIPLEIQLYLLLAAAAAAGLLRHYIFALVVVAIATASLYGLPLPGWTGLALAFASGVLLFLVVSDVPLHGGAAAIALLLAYGLAVLPWGHSLTGIPLAYCCVWIGCRHTAPLPGDYSYGLYLSAYPLQQCLMQFLPGMTWLQLFTMALPAGMALAALLWHFVENPVLRMSRGRSHEWCTRASPDGGTGGYGDRGPILSRPDRDGSSHAPLSP